MIKKYKNWLINSTSLVGVWLAWTVFGLFCNKIDCIAVIQLLVDSCQDSSNEKPALSPYSFSDINSVFTLDILNLLKYQVWETSEQVSIITLNEHLKVYYFMS